MKMTFKLSALSVAIISLSVSSALYAQDAKDAVSNKSQVEEEVLVTGFRASLEKALNKKRNADGVVDAIFAEDVGKSTDQNIADALSRVTGVTVQEEDGEGTRISVRGAGASLNQISLNGVALTSGVSGSGDNAIADQSVDLSAFSSDILAAIEVYKTSAADHDEGSLGANVVLRSVKPLELRKPKRTLEVQGRYNEYIDDHDRKFAGSFSGKLFDDTFGYIVTLSDETQQTRKDEFKGAWDDQVFRVGSTPNVDLASGRDLAVDAATGETIPGEVEFLTMGHASYQLNLNQRDRQSASVGLQWQPTNETDIQLDLNYTKQETTIDNHELNAQFDLTGANFRDPTGDPQRPGAGPVEGGGWWIVDQNTHTLQRRLVRTSKGRVYRELGGNTSETTNNALTIKHFFTDDLSAEMKFGYSKTGQESAPEAQVLLSGNADTSENSVSLATIGGANPDGIILEPAGYDCTSGTCELVVSTGASRTVAGSVPGGTRNTSAPNTNNPLDPYLFTVTAVRQRVNDIQDTNKVFFLDFDWTVDTMGITEVEFGAKYSNRIKDVFAVTNSFRDNGQAVDANGEPFSINGLNTITMADLIDQNRAFPVDNFMEDIVDNRNPAFLQGWGVVDPFKVLAIASPSDGDSGRGISRQRNPANSRLIDQDVNAAYFKLNFNYLNDFISGNVGLRYVRTKTSARAFNSIQFQRNANAYDPYDLVYNRQLANTALSPCWDLSANATNVPMNPDTTEILGGDGRDDDNRQLAVNLPAPGSCMDWQITHQFSGIDDSTFPALDPGTGRLTGAELDPNNPDYLLQVLYDGAGNVTSIERNGISAFGRADAGRFPFRGNFLSSWRDLRTVAGSIVDPVYGDPADPRRITSASAILDENASQRRFEASDSSTNTLLLPSLNLNFLFNEELIGRFSASKTMARPRFDSTKPGGRLDERLNNVNGNGRLDSISLKPLESNNLDLSLEWYFSEDSLASIAVFHKDMSNFEERVGETYLWRDVRSNYDLDGIETLDDVLFIPEPVLDPNTGEPMLDEFTGRPVWSVTPGDELEGGGTCMPDRMAQFQLQNAWTFNCHALTVDSVRNGRGATIKGVELIYNQSYDFLPGLLSGFGLNINYTYADSESEEEALETTIGSVRPLPQPFTPKHSANTTLYWEKGGLMFRLANRYNSEQLVSRSVSGNNAATWQEGTNRMDFSSSYKITDNINLTFQALNITDEVTRRYLTSTGHRINGEVFNEGNALDRNVYRGRTVNESKTGRQFRLGVRASF